MTPITLEPPPQMSHERDPWIRWLFRLYQIVGQGGQGTFPKLQVANATFTNENAFQDLLNVDKGIYVNYSSTVNEIIYGFAANVIRSGGSAITVGAQINAYAGKGATGGVWGLATTSVAEAGANVGVCGYEPNTVNLEPANTHVKWGIYNVFKNRGDGETTVAAGLGANQYNLYAVSMVIESQARSGTGEYCGWGVGIDFHEFWCDQQSPPAWSALVSYDRGMTVTSGGLLWRAITPSTNQLPAAGSAYWVQRTYTGTTDLGVGIDFTTMSIASMARMASAIRLRSTQYFHWEETGAIGSTFDPVTGLHHLSDNQGSLRFAIDVATGDPHYGSALAALGGGAPPTFGTIGGTGPTTAAQHSWMKAYDGAGTAFWVPAWK